jgi:hypothetical protein
MLLDAKVDVSPEADVSPRNLARLLTRVQQEQVKRRAHVPERLMLIWISA